MVICSALEKGTLPSNSSVNLGSIPEFLGFQTIFILYKAAFSIFTLKVNFPSPFQLITPSLKAAFASFAVKFLRDTDMSF